MYYPDPSNTASKVLDGPGGYTNNDTMPSVVLQSALAFVGNRLGELVKTVSPPNTVVAVSAKHDQSSNSRADLTIIDDGDMTDAFNRAWEEYVAMYKDTTRSHLVAHTMDDDGALLWLSDRSPTALHSAKQSLLGHSGTGLGSGVAGNVVVKPLTQVDANRFTPGEEVADFFSAEPSDDRVPGVINAVQQGTVWAGSKLPKIAERGGFHPENRHVPITAWGAGVNVGIVDGHVDTNQITPTILSESGLRLHGLQVM